MALLISIAVLLPALDSDLNEYEFSCKIMMVQGKAEIVCSKSSSLFLESRYLNIKSTWMPREPLRIVFGKDHTGSPTRWLEFAIRRVGGLGETFAF
jgi:hypothetical protein